MYITARLQLHTKGMFGTTYSQLLSLVLHAHAFQTAKQCIFYKKNLYMKVTLKNYINPFSKFILANTLNTA